MVEALHPHNFDLLIHDSQVPWARVAGDYLGLPRIISHPMFPIVSPERIAVPGEEDERLRPDPARAKTELEASWLSIARTWGVELGEWHRIVHSTAETTIAYTIEEILGEWQFEDAGWVCVGPLMEALPREPPPERPLVYVCYGTSFNRRPEQFRVVIEALAGEPVDVLMSGGMGPITAADLEPLPPNFTFEDFVPNREALARASVHITHGGCNSTHEALLAGVPMVFLPQAYDQFPLAVAISALGAGRFAEEVAADVREGVRWSLLDPLATARAEDLGERLATFDGEQRVADVIERVLARSEGTAT
jgi:MGT family glycosyltransferase